LAGTAQGKKSRRLTRIPGKAENMMVMTEPRTTLHYRKRRQRIIDYLGGECIECGLDDTSSKLRLYHSDPELRPSFSMSLCMYMDWKKLVKLLNDTELLCSECWREMYGSNIGHGMVDHGGGTSGKHNCKCRECKDKKNVYMRAWRKERKYVKIESNAP